MSVITRTPLHHWAALGRHPSLMVYPETSLVTPPQPCTIFLDLQAEHFPWKLCHLLILLCFVSAYFKLLRQIHEVTSNKCGFATAHLANYSGFLLVGCLTCCLLCSTTRRRCSQASITCQILSGYWELFRLP